jgi:ubiquinone/menaquinone biosynthesis C-methylase UbiE
MLSHHHHKEVHSIESSLHELPVSTGSIDLVLLPHLLEYLDNPRRLLAEACRIVKPEGHIAIVGFNPFSLWGLRKLFSGKSHIPWSSNFLKANLLKRWLVLADFEIVTHKSFLFRPPFKHESLFRKVGFLEWIGKKCFPGFGGVYVVIAKAKVVPLTPIKTSWKQKISDVRIPPIGVPRPTTRNKT